MKGLINEELIYLDLKEDTQLQVLEKLSEALYKENRIFSKEDFLKGVLAREEEITTGFGNGFAIPHCKGQSVKTPSIAIGRTENLVKWNAIDDKGVNFIILIAVPEENKDNIHLKIISKLASKLIDEEFREKLHRTTSKDEIIQNIIDIKIEEGM
ncbi:fructose PTS transporter subunit IIA [Clostridium sp. D2Q-11]|uniref:Fructose PTS transporter subunit IIA n=1 Tax=Anaeromonas frigoriresistens TaxID=2683708 RepID=A0A942UZC4_9FIRM|nr:fructose PTS transporter subunit IIA [Anaeromonas frigoriresistens]MBS4538347.1 fructose PTS transporter subunit IIA [Anaeromonas frigoriresistens]